MGDNADCFLKLGTNSNSTHDDAELQLRAIETFLFLDCDSASPIYAYCRYVAGEAAVTVQHVTILNRGRSEYHVSCQSAHAEKDTPSLSPQLNFHLYLAHGLLEKLTQDPPRKS